MTEIDTVNIDLDQFEAMRLCDLEGMDQSEAGRTMGISRGTVQRLLYVGRKRMLEAILSNQGLTINLRNSEGKNVGMHSHQQRRRRRERRS